MPVINRINEETHQWPTTSKTERAERSAPTPQDPAGPHHVADEPVADADALDATVRSPTTETGLPVEEQIQKEWDPKKDGGLPTPLSNMAPRQGARTAMSRPIEDYGIIGNAYTAALVSRDGSIDWLCLPRFDSELVFAALLGEPKHGRWLLAPEDPEARCSRAYRGETGILETRFETAEGVATVIDFMPLTGREDQIDLIRLVRGDKRPRADAYRYRPALQLRPRHTRGCARISAAPARWPVRTRCSSSRRCRCTARRI